MEDLPKGMLIIGAVLFLGLFTMSAASAFVNEEERTCTVEEKDRTRNGNSGSDMRIYTEECGTLAVGDILWRGQFDSADIYADLEPDNSYQIRTVGWRIPIMSEFPRVLGHPRPAGQ